MNKLKYNSPVFPRPLPFSCLAPPTRQRPRPSEPAEMFRPLPGSALATAGGDPAAPAAFRGKTLLLPAVSFGNVGQLAADILLSTALAAAPGPAAGAAAKGEGATTLESTSPSCIRVGHFESHHVLPVAGQDAFAGVGTSAPAFGAPAAVALPCEVYLLPRANAVVLQRRSMCVRGRAQLFADEIAAWCSTCGFAQVILLGGADSGALRDNALRQGVQQGCAHFVATSAVPGEVLQRATTEYRSWQRYDQAERDANGDVVVRASDARGAVFPANVHMAGLSKRLFAACERSSVPLLVLLCFVSEGYNVPDGVRLATNLCEHLPEMAPKERWVIPPSWSALAPNQAVDPGMFY